jgi:type III secretion protein R
MTGRGGLVTAAAVIAVTLLPATAFADDVSLGSRPVPLLLLLGALSLIPFVLVMITSFVRIAVVLSILRSALGTPQVPPTMVITGLAVVLTLYVMAPTGGKVLEAVQPALADHSPLRGGGARAGQSDEGRRGAPKGLFSSAGADALFDAGSRAREPIREFLLRHSAPRDRRLFVDLARRMRPAADRAAVRERDLLVLVPSFVVGELSMAFRIGFVLFIPFLVIDMVVANLLLALGMHMLSPTSVSLPFKLLLFVLVDGWHLLVQGLVLGYVTGGGP